MTDFDRLLAAIRENPGHIARRMVYADALADAGRELEAIMQRIIAIPDDDGLRLDYAAELERTAGTVECPMCQGTGRDYVPYGERCDRCSGSGRVSDGRAELAEFIRVQVELATDQEPCSEWCNNGLNTCDECRNRDRLRARELELWGYLPTRNGVRSFFESTLPGAAFCPESDGGKHLGSGFPIVIVHRGLPAVVRCALAEWMGGECGQCQGRGQRTIYGDGSGPWAKCQYCVDGRTPGIGPRLAQGWPIVAVEVTDKRPHFAGDLWWFHSRSDAYLHWPDDCRLPRELLAATGGHFTEPAARAAASDALLAWARGQRV